MQRLGGLVLQMHMCSRTQGHRAMRAAALQILLRVHKALPHRDALERVQVSCMDQEVWPGSREHACCNVVLLMQGNSHLPLQALQRLWLVTSVQQ